MGRDERVTLACGRALKKYRRHKQLLLMPPRKVLLLTITSCDDCPCAPCFSGAPGFWQGKRPPTSRDMGSKTYDGISSSYPGLKWRIEN